jgi:glycosyltransferase involved in cell wall biosynthesis
MRILFFCFDGHGGGYTNLKILFSTLVRLYPEDHYTVVAFKDSDIIKIAEQYKNAEFLPIQFLGHRLTDRFYALRYALKKIIKKQNIDLLWTVNYGTLVPVTIPQVMTMNNLYQVFPWKNVVNLHPAGKFYLMMLRYIFRNSLRFTDSVITQTELIKNYISQIPYNRDQIVVIPKAVETEKDFSFEPLPENYQKFFASKSDVKPFTYLYVANRTPQKNYVPVIRAIQNFSEQGEKIRLALTLSETEIVDLAGEIGYRLIEEGYIIPLRWVHKQYLKSVYDICDACVMPSILESLSSAHLEAMQWKKPQICSDLPYAHDLCGNAAIYASPYDVDAWTLQMLKLKNDTILQQSLIQKGLRQMEVFPQSWEDVATKYHRHFEDIVRERT